jgi:type II secretory pathway pseudopilin PulG
MSRKERSRRRRGLTLIELTVVLVILIALAGILVPTLPGIVKRAHQSSGATNLTEVTKAMQEHRHLYMTFPDRLDSLVNESGAVIDEMPYSGAGLSVVDLSADPQAARIGGALNAVGVTTTLEMADDPENATFDPYSAAPDIAISGTGGSVVELDPTTASYNGLGLEAPDAEGYPRYFIFGLGGQNTGIGKVMADAPVHFPGAGSPNAQYHRFLVVFQVTDHGPADFVGTVVGHGASLDGIDHALEHWFGEPE